MIKYIIIVVVILLAVTLIAGLVMRRKHHAIVERLEKEKLQVQHYPIFEELTKLKSLNMNGQTEEMFEKWRSEWTEVIDGEIIKLNSLLFDAEDCIDRLNFKKASVIEEEIETRIHQCDEKRLSILNELEELIGSEEKNRIEMEQLKDYYRSARKTVLAHQHSFGPALVQLEERIAAFNPAFAEFDELTQQGNYLEAREIVLKLNVEAQAIYSLLSDIPGLLSEIQSKIPASLHDLRNGLREMEEQNYYLQHLELVPFLDATDKELKELKIRIANLDINFVRDRVIEIQNDVDNYYDLLEKEVHSKAFVDKHIETIHTELHHALAHTKEIFAEVEQVRNSYRIEEQEADIPKLGIKSLESLENRYEEVNSQLAEKKAAYTTIHEELAKLREEVEQIQDTQEKFSNSLKNLRIDENKARYELEEIKKQLSVTDRKLNKANIPGIPDEVEARMEEADEKIFIVMESLKEVPINIEQVYLNVGIARKSVDDITKRVEEMLENVILIESLIQFGNRYRATNGAVDEKLTEAEQSFLQFRYVKALDEAASAVEMIDPSAIQRIQQLVQEKLTVNS